MHHITRQFHFDAGHRVYKHEGKCANLHGHRYVAEVTLTANELDELDRVIDFGRIKSVIGDWIDKHWDHNMLLNSEDPIVMFLAQSHQTGEKHPYIFTKKNPTAETIAQELWEIVKHLCRSHFHCSLSVVSVRIWETPNCNATYYNPLQ